ncbi:MAG: hypothetical protein PF442_08775 [Desulfobulbaceae bacterium]|jgi:hypothetical protein|nr:hypothetical protein [Desulfobulbaceae bacterium]
MTTTGSLPAWSSAGVLPPVKPGMSGSSPERSPYQIDLISLVDRFATSPDRMQILEGFLKFREELHALGINSGFQWLDGSFLENIETLENRPPGDMDVVTFLYLPAGEDQRSMAQKSPRLFDQSYLKSTFAVDGYFSVLGQPLNAGQVKCISYWYSMWSHRRNGLWKGFVQVDLDASQDADARAILNLSGGAHHE